MKLKRNIEQNDILMRVQFSRSISSKYRPTIFDQKDFNFVILVSIKL